MFIVRVELFSQNWTSISGVSHAILRVVDVCMEWYDSTDSPIKRTDKTTWYAPEHRCKKFRNNRLKLWVIKQRITILEASSCGWRSVHRNNHASKTCKIPSSGLLFEAYHLAFCQPFVSFLSNFSGTTTYCILVNPYQMWIHSDSKVDLGAWLCQIFS